MGRPSKAIRRHPGVAKAVLCTVMAVICVVCLVVTAGARGELRSERDRSTSLETARSKAQHDLEAKQRDADAKATVEAYNAGGHTAEGPAPGVLKAMKTTDDAVMDRFLGRMLTWDSSASYEASRKAAHDEWGLPTDGDFLTRFMAPDTCKTSRNGNVYCLVDTQGLSSRYAGHTSMMTGHHDDIRTYVGQAEYLVPPVKGVTDGSTTTRTARFAWSMGKDGTLLSIQWINVAG